MFPKQYEDEGSLGESIKAGFGCSSGVTDAGVEKPLRVVPLFKTLDDLNSAAGTTEQLYSIPAYIGSLEDRKVTLQKKLVEQHFVSSLQMALMRFSS